MKRRLRASWEKLRSSYWFIPSILAIAAIVLSLVMVEIDKRAGDRTNTGPQWIMGAGADGVRAVLQTIAGSMITVAGTVFSITILALSLASQQFGPRLLRNFMRDRANQMVLGVFTATFLYCILVLRTVSGQEHAAFVPLASSLVAVVLAILGVGVLIYFIHHVAVSIQAPYIVARVSRELDEQIDRLFPETLGEPPPGEDVGREGGLPRGFDDEAVSICLDRSGYIQHIDQEDLLEVAREHDLIIRVLCRPGAFAVRGEGCLQVWPAARFNEEIARGLRSMFTIGRARTTTQDVSFAVDQLVEVAARSLSPSLNDPYTAISCIDRLGDSFSRLAVRRIPSPLRYDKEGHLRVVAEPFDLVDLVIQSIEPIRQYGSAHMLIVLRLLDTLAVVGGFIQREEDRHILLKEIDWIAASADTEHEDDPQRKHIERRAARARDAIKHGGGAESPISASPLH